MNKKLNIELLRQKLTEKGLSQSDVGKKLRVKRQAVSLWMKGNNLPKPDKLLKLSLLLDLKYSDLINIDDDPLKPKVAFKLTANRKKTKADIESAEDMGYALEDLAKFLSINKYELPPTLIEPKVDYEYITKIVEKLRDDNNLNTIILENTDIINIYKKYYAYIIPVLWGVKEQHENALHIHLPKNKTTWVYINIDSSLYDIKFWLAHELGHILAPQLLDTEAEKFANRFAEELLLPNDYTENIYNQLTKISDKKEQSSAIEKIANELVISPYTIIKNLARYADYKGIAKIEFAQKEIGRLVNLYKAKTTLTKSIFNKEVLKAEELYNICTDYLKSDFFKILRDRLDKTKYDSAYVQRLLRMNILDAKNLHSYLLGKKH